MSKFIGENNQDHRYSRQSYTIGQDAQIKLSEASVLVFGYNSLGQEIVRNLALLGISKIDIYYQNKIHDYQKTSLYYPINANNELPIEELKKLNPTIQINVVNVLDEYKELDKKKIKK